VKQTDDDKKNGIGVVLAGVAKISPPCAFCRGVQP